MISICIPTYEQKGHGAKYLAELLVSITRLNFNAPYEILVSDNATDGSIKKVCEAFAGLPITYYFNPVKGASENINNCIELARYDKIKLMMQDDLFIDPYALQNYSDALDMAGWVVANSTHINARGLRTGQRLAEYDPHDFDHNKIGMPSVVAFRRSELRFDPSLKTFCDLYFYYQLFQLYGPPEILRKYLIAQRFHDASLSRNQPPSHKKDKQALIRRGLIPGSLPRVVVAVVVYDRFENVDRWLDLWARCNTKGAELVIIVNNKTTRYEQYETVRIIERPNVGFDIGALQDVCKERLEGFPDYDYLLCCTDDTIPMSPDFINDFIDPFEKRVGLTCMQISREVTRHVRTTGFCIPKAVAKRLVFPADPIKTVQECWHFEHRGGPRTLLKQVERMSLVCLQIAPLEKSPLYDMGFWYRNEQARKQAHLYDRMKEHEKIFPNLEYDRAITREKDQATQSAG